MIMRVCRWGVLGSPLEWDFIVNCKFSVSFLVDMFL